MARQHAQAGFGRTIVVFSRAFLLRCPSCGNDGLFEWWFRLKERCNTCGLALGRGRFDHEFRAIILNLLIPFLVWFVLYFMILVSTWPDPPSTLLDWGSVVLMIVLPCLHYPVSQTLAIAIDVLNHPPGGDSRRRRRGYAHADHHGRHLLRG
ncbi:MAG TPA: DUF983 domain-containing protein [Chloroflexota bacterium]|nr:DUF983 domain-containing protein [Chloroflexota bacterium]